MSRAVLVEEAEDRVVLRLNRPEVRNAIDQQTVAALHEACALLEERPRVALLVGEGGTFAAGADIAQLRERRREDALRGINSSIFDRIRRLPMPTIGLLDGYALGGGAELAYACDFRIGTPAHPHRQPRARAGHPGRGRRLLAAGRAGRRAGGQGDPAGRADPRRRRGAGRAPAHRGRRARRAAGGRAPPRRPDRRAGTARGPAHQGGLPRAPRGAPVAGRRGPGGALRDRGQAAADDGVPGPEEDPAAPEGERDDQPARDRRRVRRRPDGRRHRARVPRRRAPR